MSRRTRMLVGLALLAVLVIGASAANALWLLPAMGVGMATGLLTWPVQRYYRRAGLLGRRVLVAVGVLLCLAVMALYVWGMAVPFVQSGQAGEDWGRAFWIVWTLLMALPAALLVMLVRAWRRAGTRPAQPTNT